MRAEVTARLSRFPGRTKQIGGRPYLYLDDYRVWAERKTGGQLPVGRGVITLAWNNLLASFAATGTAEIAGIRVKMLGKDDDDTLDRATDKLIAPHPMITSLTTRLGLSGALAIAEQFISRLLIEIRMIEIASDRLAKRYLAGRQKILFKAASKQLEELRKQARSLANTYNQVVDAVEDSALGCEGWRGFGKIDSSKSETLAQQEASGVVSEVVALAKMDMFSSFGDSYKAAQVLADLLKTVWKADVSAGGNVT